MCFSGPEGANLRVFFFSGVLCTLATSHARALPAQSRGQGRSEVKEEPVIAAANTGGGHERSPWPLFWASLRTTQERLTSTPR